jgi:hypothetical protein
MEGECEVQKVSVLNGPSDFLCSIIHTDDRSHHNNNQRSEGDHKECDRESSVPTDGHVTHKAFTNEC